LAIENQILVSGEKFGWADMFGDERRKNQLAIFCTSQQGENR
jgi:hypothetical protein